MKSLIKTTIVTILITGGIAATATSFTYDTRVESLSNNQVEQYMFFETVRNKIFEEAVQKIGTPYVWGGESLEEGGFDCSGLVQHVYNEIGLKLPRVSQDQIKYCQKITKEEAKVGDLVFFGDPAYHVGIWVGNDSMIHAPQPGENIRMDKIGNYDSITFGRYLPF